MVYMLWMMTNMNEPLPDNIRKALEYHQKKYGRVPNIVEYSKLIEQAPDVEKVTLKPVQIPKNILLVGVQE